MERDQLIALVTAAQTGDEKALNELFNAFYNDVYYFALKTVKDENVACDITQESFFEVLTTIGQLREPAAFVKWMKQITYHQCTRYFKKKTDVLVEEDEDGNTVFDSLQEEKAEFIPDKALDQEELKKTLMELIDALTEEQRTAVMMFYYDEFSIKQIAEIQGVTENTVKSRLNYARKGIRQSVEDYEKKTGVKLCCTAAFPFILWLFKGYFSQGAPASAPLVAKGVAASTGIAVTATATATAATATAAGIGAKLAGMALGTKIAAGFLAAGLAIGGVALFAQNDASIGAEPEQEIFEEIVFEGEEKYKGEEEIFHTPYLVPDGGTYTTADGKCYAAGETVTTPPAIGDTFETKDYTYRYSCYLDRTDGETERVWVEADFGGWSICVKDRSLDRYEPLEESVNGAVIKMMPYAFAECTNMVEAPALPKTVYDLLYTFADCKSLVVAPEIPDGITSIASTFPGCTSLVKTPYLPDSVEIISNAFSSCTALTTVTNFPSRLIWMVAAFDRCSSLVSVPPLPETVEHIGWSFQGCSSLVTAPVIPASVKSMPYAFMSCSSMTGVVEINAQLAPDRMPCGGSCQLCATGYHEACVNCSDCCNYADVFGGEMRLPIKLVGSCPKLAEIAETDYWDTVELG